jgi:hypothetical protein
MLAALHLPSPRTSTILDVDFKNFEYPWDKPAGHMTAWRWLDTTATTRAPLADSTAQLDALAARPTGITRTILTIGTKAWDHLPV